MENNYFEEGNPLNIRTGLSSFIPDFNALKSVTPTESTTTALGVTKKSGWFDPSSILQSTSPQQNTQESPEETDMKDNNEENPFGVSPQTNPFFQFNTQEAEAFADETKKFEDFVKSESKKIASVEDAFGSIIGHSDEDIEKYRDDVIKDWRRRNPSDALKSDEELISDWNSMSVGDKEYYAVRALGEKILEDNSLVEFNRLLEEGRRDYEDNDYSLALGMLATKISSSPYYRPLDVQESEKNAAIRESFVNSGLVSHIDSRLDKVAENMSYDYTNIVREFRGNDNIFSKIGKIGYSAVSLGGDLSQYIGGQALKGVMSIPKNIGARITGGLTQNFSDDDIDKAIRDYADSYIENRAKEIYNDILSDKYTDEMRHNMAGIFRTYSEKYSPEYNIEKSSELTNVEEDDILKAYSKMLASSRITGEVGASVEIDKFWKNTIEDNQFWLDKLGRTGMQNVNAFVATTASFAALVANGYYMVDAEDGYSDALVRDNNILKWAANLQETGKWSLDGQEKYKEFGINNYQIYRNFEESQSAFSTKDIWDIFGQYGFTAGSAAISCGGSLVVRSAVKGITRNVMNQGFRGSVARAMIGKETRNLIKKGIISGATEAEILAAKEAAVKMAARKLYRGNLAMAAITGTGEGALEARSTYTTFLDDHADVLNNIQNSLEQLGGLPNEALDSDMERMGMQRDADKKFSDEQYANARIAISNELIDAYNRVEDKIQEEALDAAYLNFLSNSMINGALNVYLKESALFGDARTAVKTFRNEGKKAERLFSLNKNAAGQWKATVNSYTKEAFKRDPWKTLGKESWKITKSVLKDSGGEGLEEYAQSLSDATSRAIFEQDLTNYMGTVFNKDAREAFQRDWNSMISAGLYNLGSEASDIETIKEGLFGMLSTMAGGISPVRFIQNHKWVFGKENKGSWANKGKTLLNNIWGLYDGGVQNAVLEYKQQAETAQRQVDAINTWLNNEKNQELLEHLGGAIGFKAAMSQSAFIGDEMGVEDSAYSLAIENAFMLNTLKDTDLGNAYMEAFVARAAMAEESANDFDASGKYIGNDEAIMSQINTFRNQKGNTELSKSMTDAQVVEKISSNAQEFLSLQESLNATSQKIDELFGSQEVDPLVKKTLVRALLVKDNIKQRYKTLDSILGRITANEDLTDVDKENLKTSQLTQSDKDLIATYGSIENAIKAYKKLSITTSENKPTKEQKKALAQLKASIKEYQHNNPEKEVVTNEDGTTTTVVNEPKVLTAGDIHNLSPFMQRHVLSNKDMFSEKQQEEINKYLDLVRRSLGGNDDLTITAEDASNKVIERATLKDKYETYERLLDGYIKDPRFLNQAAEEERRKERKRVLRQMYKDLLTLKEGEGISDLIDRAVAKIQVLHEEGKAEDASIIQDLLYENKEVAKYYKAFNEIQIATWRIVPTIASKVTEDAEYNRVYPALKTIALVSGLSLKEIKDLFDKSDSAILTDYLKTKDASNRSILNKEVNKTNAREVDITNETSLLDIIQECKKVLDIYYHYLAVNEALGQKIEVTAPNKTNPTTRPSNVKQVEVKARKDNSTLKIHTPGDESTSSDLGRFFSEHRVKDAVKHLKSTSKVYFMVTNDFPGVTFAVVRSSNKTPETFTIAGKEYCIIGTISRGQSETLDELGKTTSELVSMGNPNILLTRENGSVISSEINSIKDPHSQTDQSILEAKPIKDLMKDVEIQSWIQGILKSASSVLHKTIIDEISGASREEPILKDVNGKAVLFTKEGSGYMSIFSLIDNAIKNGLLESTNDEQVINELKKNEFFKEYFRTWEEFSSKGFSTNEDVYDSLIGSFIYLGFSQERGSKSVKPLYADGKLSIHPNMVENESRDNDVVIAVPSKSNNSTDADRMALQALRAIKAKKDLFIGGNPQVNFRLIESKYSKVTNLEREGNRLMGLVKLGYIRGFREDTVRRSIIIQNPLIVGSKASRVNESSAGNMIPQQQGQVTGGVVDPNTGQVIEGNPVTPEDKIKKEVTGALNKAKAIVSRIVSASRRVILDNGNSEFYQSSTTGSYTRVTSLKHCAVDSDIDVFNAEDNLAATSAAYGNIVDEVIRAFFEVLNNNESISVENIYAEIVKNPKFNGKIPNYDKYLINKFINQLVIFKQVLDANGYHVVPKDIRAFGTVPVVGEKEGNIQVAGTLDLLVYDNEGVFHIIDIKSKHSGTVNESLLNDSIEGWKVQISTYQQLLKQQYPEMTFGQNYVLPVFVSYDVLNDTKVESDGMTIKNSNAPKEPILKSGKKGSYTLDDFLVPIDYKSVSYNYSSLSESQKERVTVKISQVVPSESTKKSETTETPEAPKEENKPQSKRAHSTKDIMRNDEVSVSDNGKLKFETLSKEIQDYILARGLTSEAFNNLPRIMQEQFKNCGKS